MPEPSRLDKVFAHIALKHRLLTPKQVKEAVGALERGEKGAKSLADLLERRAVLSGSSIRKVERAVRFRELRLDGKLYGRIAIKNRLATAESVAECLALQKKAYEKRQKPKDLGTMLIERGLGADADRAIREAMAKLERDRYVADKVTSVSELDALDDGGAGKDARPKRLGGSGRKPFKKPPPLKAKGKAGKERSAVPAPAGKKGKVAGKGKRPEADTPEVDQEEARERAHRASARVGAAADEAPGRRAPGSGSGRQRLEETSDTIDPLVGPEDLSLGSSGRESKPEEGAAAPAGPADDDGDDDLPALDAAEESGGAGDLDDLDDLEDLDDLADLAPEAPPAKARPAAGLPSDTTKIAVEGGPLECPKCNVSLEVGTTQCLYCGYQLGSAPSDTGPQVPLLEEDAHTEDIVAFENAGSSADDVVTSSGRVGKAGGKGVGVGSGKVGKGDKGGKGDDGGSERKSAKDGSRPGKGKATKAAPESPEPTEVEPAPAGAEEPEAEAGAEPEAEEAPAPKRSGKAIAAAPEKGGSGKLKGASARRPLKASGKQRRAGAAGEGDASAEAPPADAPALATAAVREQAFAKAFGGAKTLSSTPRGDLVRAKEKSSGQERLVLRLPKGFAPAAEHLDAFLADAAKLGALDVRQLLRLEWVGRDADGTYAVYEGAPGVAASVRAEQEPLNRKSAACIVKQVAVALAEAHGQGVLARELRPELVLIPEDGDDPVALVGVGAMRLFDPPSQGAPEVGEDPMIPPERRRKAGRAEVRSDLYGLGALLCTLVTGKPLTGNEPKELPDVPGPMATFLKKSLAPATGMRYLDVPKSFFDLDRCPGAKGYEVALAR